jgi:hypothetical protein
VHTIARLDTASSQRAGITVHYCADEFENDGSLASFMIKTNKRIGAADRTGFDLVAP